MGKYTDVKEGRKRKNQERQIDGWIDRLDRLDSLDRLDRLDRFRYKDFLKKIQVNRKIYMERNIKIERQRDLEVDIEIDIGIDIFTVGVYVYMI